MNVGSQIIDRREFLKLGVLGGIGLFVPNLWAEKVKKRADIKNKIWIIHGKDKKKIMRKAFDIISSNNGLGKTVKKIAIKVNAAWARTPEVGANTHPELVDEFIKGCKEYGFKDIVLPEHPCNRGKVAFPKSGILEVVKKHKVRMIDLGVTKLYTKITIPKGKRLEEVLIGSDYLDADVIVNIPVAKHHGTAGLSCAMKNWMGVVKDRGYWHRNNLHQCIADFCTFIKPKWTIIDATRIMLSRGPQGPSDNMVFPNFIAVSKDQVALDYYIAYHYFKNILSRIKYISIAQEMGIGNYDPQRTIIQRIET